MATFTLLIALLRNAFEIAANEAKNENEDTNEMTAQSLADDLYNNYLTYTDTRKRPPSREFRLTMSEVDKDFFRDLLNGQNPSPRAESHRRLLYAWDYINQQLILPIVNDSNLTIEEQLNRLQNLKDNILEHSVIIHIVCDNMDEAYQLFEVLNDRGKELAIGDYLRSTTLELLDSNPVYQDRVSECWDDILSRKNADKYIKDYLTSHIATLKKSNIHRQFQKKFFTFISNNDNLERDVRDRVINLKNMFDVYEMLKEGIYPYQNPTANSWQRNRLTLLIKYLDHRHCIPFLMALFECGTENDFIESVMTIEKFVFRYITVSGLRANKLSSVYKTHILNMRRKGVFNLNEFKNDLCHLLNVDCTNQRFAEAIENNLKYKSDSKTIKKMRYFLTTLEDHYSWYTQTNRPQIPRPSMNVLYNLDNLEIEHVYPQNASQQIASLEPLKNTIGNLTFWSPNDNKIAGNNPFTQKQIYYQKSNIAITRILGNLRDWDVTTIEERKNFYIDIAQHVFNIYPNPIPMSTTS